jgi:hypothetical protein
MNKALMIATWMSIGVFTWHRAFKRIAEGTTIATHGLFVVAFLVCMLVCSFVLSLFLGPLSFFVFIGDRE